MNILDKFMHSSLPFTQNISVNKTSTIGVDNIPAYKVESEEVLSANLHFKNIRYFSINNSTGTGYIISLHTEIKINHIIQLVRNIAEDVNTILLLRRSFANAAECS
jgi:hypothetical protein